MQADGPFLLIGRPVVDDQMSLEAEEMGSEQAPADRLPGLLDQGRGPAIGGNRDPGPDLGRTVRLTRAHVDPDDPTALHDRPNRASPLEHFGPGDPSLANDQVVQEESAQADPRKAVNADDLRRDLSPLWRRDPDPSNRVVARPLNLIGQAHPIQDSPAFGAEELAANLVPRERRRVHQHDLDTSTRESKRQRSPGQAGSGDGNLE